MKKLAAVLAASVLCLSMFAGCGDTKEEASTSASDAKEADSESSGEKSEGGWLAYPCLRSLCSVGTRMERI
ncbi:hypothetical protein [Lactonifactor longoviformis]|uniref:hypothetical protein n=1 Tax=Lactonifactor longoviformis TaxID=341220 RepID=UPI0036F2EF03